MKSKLVVFAVVLLGLTTTGAAMRWIEAPLWTTIRAEQPALRLESAGAAAGQGVTLGLLGGFRAIVADFTWLRLHVIWEQRDLPATETLLRLVTAIDPRPLYFWTNGARIVAFDMSAWRIAAAGGYDAVPAEQQERIGAEQARLAIRGLDEAMKFHPGNATLWIERANIELNRLHDTAAAAASYRRAWEQPGAPYYAARLHAELLRRLGRKAEALAWLVKLHPQLPPEDEGTEVVLGRIRDLERELAVPTLQTYRPPVRKEPGKPGG
ncbi:MAG: hypothetical protein NTV51_19270 [Verrucomicrobia bacterium]|nr:hypothetical protein [Verrucomicrobiota bacterium]